MNTVEELEKRINESYAFSIQMPNGDKLNFTRWRNEKNYAICINRAGTNMYEKVGHIRHQSIKQFRNIMYEWFGGNK